MIRREIDFDEETDQILERLEALADECEQAHRDALLSQVKRAEIDFQQGRTVTWDEIKRRNGL